MLINGDSYNDCVSFSFKQFGTLIGERITLEVPYFTARQFVLEFSTEFSVGVQFEVEKRIEPQHV